MSAIFGYIIPGSIKESGKSLTIDFIDLDGFEEELAISSTDDADRILGMIDDQSTYGISARNGRIQDISGTLHSSPEKSSARLSDGTRVIFPRRMDVPVDAPLTGNFRGVLSNGIFDAISAAIHVPQPDINPAP